MEQERQSKSHQKSSSDASDPPGDHEIDERESSDGDAIALPARIALPAALAGSGTLDQLVDAARFYARASTAENTNKAYAADWKHFARWCRRHGADPLGGRGPFDGGDPLGGDDPVVPAPCPDPKLIGLYLTELAAPTNGASALSVSTIDRRLSGLAWNYAQRGFTLDRKDRHIATVLAGIKRKHARPPVQKEAILPEDILAMVATLPYDLRGDLVSISANGRHVDVATSAGTGSVRMRFKDALDQVGSVPGLQVHRSHWIAADFATGHRIRQTNNFVELKTGKMVPLSAAKVPELELMVSGQ